MNNPFRYSPHPWVRQAARQLIAHIAADPDLHARFAPGKMLGVLIVSAPEDIPSLPEVHAFYPMEPASRLDGPSVGLDGISVLAPDEGHRPVHYLAAFSGNAGDSNFIEGFVPPLYDLLDPAGTFKKGEAEISSINAEVTSLETSGEYLQLIDSQRLLRAEMEKALEEMRQSMTVSRARREEIRRSLECALQGTSASAPDAPSAGHDGGLTPEEITARTAALVRQSQHEKAELKRLKKFYTSKLAEMEGQAAAFRERIAALKARRKSMSDVLQRWIFEHFEVSDALGERSNVWEVFASAGLVPPAGTGECAAPKLFQFAYDHGLVPMYLGEFWYGASPEGSVRNHGDFYPSCSSKCGILLPFMMRGLDICDDFARPDDACDGGSGSSTASGDGCDGGSGSSTESGDGCDGKAGLKEVGIRIVYEDEWLLAIDKPGGMPSVPGLDGRRSALEHLQDIYPALEAVHRLDMDTMGLLLFAKSPAVAVTLRQQFEARTVRKTYRALLAPATAFPAPSVSAAASSVSSVVSTPSESAASAVAPLASSAPSVSAAASASSAFAELRVGQKGIIDLPLAPDYEDRPRQKVDFVQGKPARTEYEVTEVRPDGVIAITFHPLDGRTHQLRVHAAHHLGLGRPILGDPLYGGSRSACVDNVVLPLQLRAVGITITHPVTGQDITLRLD